MAQFYPNNVKFEDDDICDLTFCFEGNNINSFDSLIEKYNKNFPQWDRGSKDRVIRIRKENNKLFLDNIFEKNILFNKNCFWFKSRFKGINWYFINC